MWFVNCAVRVFCLRVTICVCKAVLQSNFLAAAFLAEGWAVKVERSRARGHVASNTLTAQPGAIHWLPRNCFALHHKLRLFSPLIRRP